MSNTIRWYGKFTKKRKINIKYDFDFADITKTLDVVDIVKEYGICRIPNYLKTENYKLPVYFQAGKSPVILESNSLPTTFLLSKEGEIVMKKVGAARWNASKVHHTIDRLLIE